MGKYDNNKIYISEFSDTFLIFIAYFRDYESYNFRGFRELTVDKLF